MTQYITPRELAIRFRLTPEDVQAAVDSGEIPFVTIAGEIRFDLADVQNAVRRTAQPNMERRTNDDCSLTDG